MLATLAGLAAAIGLVLLILVLVGILAKGLLALAIVLLVVGIVAYVFLSRGTHRTTTRL
jgi:predicted membrane protein